jgi:hypothetical protein
MFSRIATGLIVGAFAGLGTSGFDAVSGLGSTGFAVEFVTPEGALLAEPGAFGMLAVPRAGFEPDPTAEAGLEGRELAGLGVVFDVDASAGELGAEMGAAEAGLVAALVAGTGFGVCVCFGAETPVEV